jgi:hypothetical protein
MCAAIALLSSTVGLEKVDAKGGPFSLHGPWPSTSAQNNAADAGAIVGYEAKSFLRRQSAGIGAESLQGTVASRTFFADGQQFVDRR